LATMYSTMYAFIDNIIQLNVTDFDNKKPVPSQGNRAMPFVSV